MNSSMTRNLSSPRRDTLIRVVATIAVSLGVGSLVRAQQVEVQWQKPPHYVGEPLLIRVTAKQFESDVQPTCEPGPPPVDLAIGFVDVRRSESSYLQRDTTGRVTQYSSIIYMYDFHVVADRAGTYRIPSFTVKQGSRVATTKPFDLRVEDIPIDPDMRVSFVMPSGTLYPGQQVPVTIEWSYSGDFNNISYSGLRIRSSLFDIFSFEDEPVGRRDEVLPIVTTQGIGRLKAEVTQRTLDGRRFMVVSARRLMLIDKAGEYDLAPIVASVDKVTRWGRGFLGGREPVATTRIRAIGELRKLVIEPLPLHLAPPSFGGAVGKGFSIDVKVDRSVVRVGDPIELTLTLVGDGVLESAGLPALATSTDDPNAGLDPTWFRLPDEDAAGIVSDDGKSKRFIVTLRVLSESVSEIPPIAYAWFDPQTQTFQTDRSDPIALRVESARMVGAADVEIAVEGADVVESGREIMPVPTLAAPVLEPDSFDLTGADLSIEPDPDRLLVNDSERFGGYPTHAAIYSVSILLFLIAWWRRWVAEVDPELVRRRRVFKEQLRQIAHASRLPRQQAAGQIADALRHMAPHANGSLREQIDHLVSRCDVLAYAREVDSGQGVEPTLQEEAIAVAQIIAKETA